MHVNTRKLTFLGALAAISVIFVCLGTFIESNTLFFLAIASFLNGVAVRECGKQMGLGFFIATSVLSFLLAGNKLYVLTYVGFCIYVLCSECFRQKLKNKLAVMQVFLFYIMYVPILLFAPKLVYAGKMNNVLYLVLLIGGAMVLWVYNYAYRIFMDSLWPIMKNKLHM